MYRKYSEEQLAELIASPTKCCSKCKEIKPKEEFFGLSSANDGKAFQCKICSRKRMEEYNARNPDAKRRDALRRYYGLTLEDYNGIIEEQGGGCAICGKPQGVDKKSLAVDHVHSGARAGLIRGILCHRCNKWLVGRHISGELLKRAGEYIDAATTNRYVPEDYIKGPKRRRKQRTRAEYLADMAAQRERRKTARKAKSSG